MENSSRVSTETDKVFSVNDLLALYQDSAYIHLLAEHLQETCQVVHLEGFQGSSDAVWAVSLYQKIKGTHLFILNDKEEAMYFAQDLEHLLPHKEILFFPTSYRKPYQFLEIENANILQRAEVLNALTNKNPEGELIVTYPEALPEKVIRQASLIKHTFALKVGEKIDMAFLEEMLITYDFERTDFVAEAGQYAIRGGIVDVFSFSNDLPYRIEFFEDKIESIRTFDPLTQLSLEQKKYIAIIPDVQTKLLQEKRESFLSFIPQNSIIWTKDAHHLFEVLTYYFQKANDEFEQILKSSGGDIQIIKEPTELFETRAEFEKKWKSFSRVEFGVKFYDNPTFTFQVHTKAQPSFAKDFKKIGNTLYEHTLKGTTNIIASDSMRQLHRIRLIFDEVFPSVQYRDLNTSLRGGFYDEQHQVLLYTDHQLFERFHRYQEKAQYTKAKALTLKELRELKVGDYVVHIDYGIARFGGLERKTTPEGNMQEAIRLIFRDDDLLYVSIHALHKISKYTGQEGRIPPLSKLGSNEWEQKKTKTKKRLKDIARELIQLYAKRKITPGYAFSKDSYLQAELESSFLYEDTPDQAKATADVKADMEKPIPMDRLICGDVGFGKTEIAIRAAFKAALDGKQVAVLVPTTILALQHYKTFTARMEKFPITIDYICRFRTQKEINEIYQKLSEGKIDILIGTHAILSNKIKFKDLGLLIIDEEQKFGVRAKEKLREMRVNVDTLTLTATPIPRTLYFSLIGIRDLSVINTPPPNRQPVTTRLYNYSDEIIRDAIRAELRRGGQVFYVYNRVTDIESVANNIISLVPDAKVAYAHGQMEDERLEKIMAKFIEGEYDVLVSTNIIESGLDIPNANTIIIDNANMFGLSDLHQMRGRVGRSNRKAYCYLLVRSLYSLPPDALKRLRTLEEFSELGDGFKIAMRDLDLRGAGDLLNSEQSGFINELGFDAYNQILQEAVLELKKEEFAELFADEPLRASLGECNVETDLEIIIPESYVANISERLNLYITADNLKNEEELEEFANQLRDRFGPIPESVQELFKVVRLRWIGKQLGFEKIILKNNTMKAQLVPAQNEEYYKGEIFGKIVNYVAKRPQRCKLIDAKGRAIFEMTDVKTVDGAMKALKSILES
ncbi:MAG: transcription-repair coupling factor [Cytophagales bacterium]|nr:transcription-repair coupling factor [Cytophagales bacterium]MDW8384477.1 transcription-repair coupling factor [Flammeovirgaceae bacterium]